jgi:non-ribosomal peptide synthetase component F
VANRDEPATEGLIGYFVNHVVVVTRFDGEPTCREVLARVRAATLDALDHQDLPFEEFVRRARPERQGSHTPLHRVLFNVLNVPDTRLELPGVRAEIAAPAARDTTLFDLNWAFADDGERVTGLLEYDRELFDPSTADRMVADYLQVLEAFVDTPDRPLATLNLMTSTQESLALAFSEPL